MNCPFFDKANKVDVSKDCPFVADAMNCPYPDVECPNHKTNQPKKKVSKKGGKKND